MSDAHKAPPTDFGPDLRDWMEQPFDADDDDERWMRWIMASGAFDGDGIALRKRYNGWLVRHEDGTWETVDECPPGIGPRQSDPS